MIFPNDEKAMSSVCAGTDFCIAVGLRSENLYSWGLGTYGNLGNGYRKDQDTPVLFHIMSPVAKVKKQVKQIACGSRHSMALTTDGEVYSWGFGRNGRLGHGSIADFDVPQRIEAFQVSEDKKITEICCGDSHSLARSKDGRVFSWGSGSYGRLGLGAENDQYAPKTIEAIKHAIGISCNAFHSLAVVNPVGKQVISVSFRFV